MAIAATTGMKVAVVAILEVSSVKKMMRVTTRTIIKTVLIPPGIRLPSHTASPEL